MPKCAKGRSDIYDLISVKVVDKKEFDKMITEEKNKKKRYEIRKQLPDNMLTMIRSFFLINC